MKNPSRVPNNPSLKATGRAILLSSVGIALILATLAIPLLILSQRIMRISTILIVGAILAIIYLSLRIWRLSKRIHFITNGVEKVLASIERAVVKDIKPIGAVSGTWLELRKIVNHANTIIGDLSFSRGLSAATQNEPDLISALTALFPLLACKIPCERLAVAFVDQVGGVAAEHAISLQPTILLGEGYHQFLAESTLSDVARELKPRIIPDLEAYYSQKPSEPTGRLLTEGFRSSLTIPLAYGHRCVGFLFVNSSKRNAYRGDHIPVVEHILHSLTGTIYHHYLVQLMLAEAARAFIKSMEKKDNETSEHISRMSRYSHAIARHLSKNDQYASHLKPKTVRDILWYSPLHDIGKIGIPDHILFKPGPLDKPEWEIMKTHVSQGVDIIRTLDDGLARFFPQPPFATAIDIIYGHHERWDGTGYPRKIAGEAIPVPARIAAAADILDALTSDRPYKKAWSFDTAFEHMAALSGNHLDPMVYHSLVECRPEIEAIAEENRLGEAELEISVG
ncbi:MAG: hypothetical protein A2087_04595 [Spirochaetes bacterium GWD1_61_31]|nr:MAG: hypothetical protein A2Y37_09280 [Spirochaetes bacterium GWB1_60_80]OHD31611.1 MAG: hypothetical protein A2004_09495 [Spirochaetes bacterium GWC1_61_12]OHD40542.1 MAG: hypothetical protein A2087_04595 [Spirochaetes bacterium GWD1_61_31]OHD44043.1 MAG: hypothetical protein A2Y35_01770 [Spirochaetes bacterium GWE1_60_18]OHD59078.1 MAG: hypothetical protein A2Y32_02490 [Spirochaetes bacterium GWF1_60_12]HAP44559.1 hypothetical protein [Spirochaetaceae bacterium]